MTARPEPRSRAGPAPAPPPPRPLGGLLRPPREPAQRQQQRRTEESARRHRESDSGPDARDVATVPRLGEEREDDADHEARLEGLTGSDDEGGGDAAPSRSEE